MKAIFVILALCIVAVVATEEPGCCLPKFDDLANSKEAITIESTLPVATLSNVTVIQAPAHPSLKHKLKGNFTIRPLLDNGKEFLTARVERKYRTDPCTGCVVPVRVHPKLDPRNRLDKKGNVIGRKRVLPVVPELRERQRRRRHPVPEVAPRPSTVRPEFYPLTRKQVKAVGIPEPHTKLLARLPALPEFYPAAKPNRLFNPPEGWPCDSCASSTGAPFPSPL
jgi:hypothetical protein